MTAIQTLVWLAVATASIAFTIAKTQVFDFVRVRLPEGMVLELMNCPYCVSHYVAPVAVAVYQPMPFSGRWWDLVPCMFIIVTLSTLIVQWILVVARALNISSLYDPTKMRPPEE